MNTDPLQQAKEKVSELIDGMIYIILTVDPNKTGVIKQLATSLDVLLTQKKYGVKGDKKSLLEYALGNVEIPSILSVEEVVDNSYNTDALKRLAKMSTATVRTSSLSTKEGLYKEIHTAHSLAVYNGLPKILIKMRERTTLREGLNTNIIMIRNHKSEKVLKFSVADVTTLIRNKETAHYDLESHLDPTDKFYTLTSLEDRHFVILGIAEYVIATYELLRGEHKNWCAIENFPDLASFHIRRYSLDPIGVCAPFILVYLDKKWPLCSIPSFQLFRKLKKGERFKICQISDKAWIFINDKNQLIFQVYGENDVVMEHQINPPFSEEQEREKVDVKSYHDTAELLGIWGKWESSIEIINNAEKNLTNIPDPFHIKILWIKADALQNLKHNDGALICYIKLFEILNSIDSDQLNLSHECHRNIGICVFNTTEVYLSQNKPDDAICFLEKLIELYGHLTKGKIIHADLCQMVAEALCYLANIYLNKGDEVNAKKMTENLLAIPKVTTKIAEWQKVAVSILAQLNNEGEPKRIRH